MQGYEIVTIVDPQIADEDVTKTSEKINEFITSRGGDVARVQRWGRRRLAYPIKRQMEAHYLLTTYELEPEHASELEADLVLAQEVLKHMVVKLDPETFQKASEEPPAPVAMEPREEPAEAVVESPAADASAAEPDATETAEPEAEASAPEPSTAETTEPMAEASAPEPAATETAEPAVVEEEDGGGESGSETEVEAVEEDKEGT